MTIYVFTGPTLSPEEGGAELDAVFLPPAAQGDVYRASLDRPIAIGIIDGYFERVPAVWHKEILWAMSQGIHVFGSASMGALRAAELHPFGMEGVGDVYEAFLRGELEDDDEVAVRHGPAEDGYRPLSEAMVNIRATLKRAAAEGSVREETRRAMERIAKNLFYPERTYPTLLRMAADAGLPGDEIEALKRSFPEARVNQKRLDALAMLRLLRDRAARGMAPKEVRYTFEHTDAFEHARRRASRLPLAGHEASHPVLDDALREELAVEGLLPEAWQGALVRAFALEVARSHGAAAKRGEAVLRAAEAFRQERGLFQPEAFARWRHEQRLTDDDAMRFFGDEAHVRWAQTMFEPHAAAALPDHLRASGQLGRLIERITHKSRVLAEQGLAEPSLADLRITEQELLRWYFEDRLRRPIPADIDHYARRAGFSDEAAMLRAVLRERCYERVTGSGL